MPKKWCKRIYKIGMYCSVSVHARARAREFPVRTQKNKKHSDKTMFIFRIRVAQSFLRNKIPATYKIQ
jgi:hypothetical protein